MVTRFSVSTSVVSAFVSVSIIGGLGESNWEWRLRGYMSIILTIPPNDTVDKRRDHWGVTNQ